MSDTLRRRMETARVAYQQAAELPPALTDPRRVAVLRDAWLAACAEHAAEAIRKQGCVPQSSWTLDAEDDE